MIMPSDPMHVVKQGKKFCVMGVNAKGKAPAARCYKTQAQAVKQVQAINISMMRAGTLKPKGGTPPIAKRPAPKKKK
jgi:hypothetical protein